MKNLVYIHNGMETIQFSNFTVDTDENIILDRKRKSNINNQGAQADANYI